VYFLCDQSLCRWLVGKKNALCISGKANDCKYGIVKYKELNHQFPRIILWNIPRSQQGHVDYDAVESIEDGLFFSGKYEGCQVLMNHPHIYIFSNFKPNIFSMSTRKWNIIQIKMSPLEHDQITPHIETTLS